MSRPNQKGITTPVLIPLVLLVFIIAVLGAYFLGYKRVADPLSSPRPPSYVLPTLEPTQLPVPTVKAQSEIKSTV